MKFPTANDRLILALDVADRAAAERLVEATAGIVGVYKIGLEFVFAGGLDFAAELVRAGHPVFLDMKLLDIPNTVAAATRTAGAMGITYLTVHAYPQALRAAARKAWARRPPTRSFQRPSSSSASTTS